MTAFIGLLTISWAIQFFMGMVASFTFWTKNWLDDFCTFSHFQSFTYSYLNITHTSPGISTQAQLELLDRRIKMTKPMSWSARRSLRCYTIECEMFGELTLSHRVRTLDWYGTCSWVELTSTSSQPTRCSEHTARAVSERWSLQLSDWSLNEHIRAIYIFYFPLTNPKINPYETYIK